MSFKTVFFTFVATSFLLGVQGNLNFSGWELPSFRSLFNHFPLAPLTIVRIYNDKCDAGDGRNGTCLAKVECYKKKGVVRGTCALGFGVCCLMTAAENGIAFGNNTLLYKDKFGGGVDITYTIMRMSKKICQYRIDVKRLIMYEVEVDGSCRYDYMLVNQDTKFKKVCGMTENVHYYIDVKDTVIFTFHTDPGQTQIREWEIYVSQYTCDMGAPDGCGQWYWGATNKIDIWNNIDPANTHWYYLDNQHYTICVRWEAGYCTITYNENTRFQPKCNDIFERPGSTTLRSACIFTPPANAITYTFTGGVQNFYVNFSDTTNQHSGSVSNPFKNPSISYQQNRCN
ncbi:uncharacterized protein LOC135195791 [Macrobrachium nipponense]|uniref:uncharacterized protein LOC135195791 n=1 Tax=Macrobrachium nipponense TaxID=159736 RepID=UPI0030C82100